MIWKDKTLILVHGRMESGKDTFITFLCKYLGASYLLDVYHNAKAPADICQNVFGIDYKKGETGRRCIQDVTDTGYNIEPFFWERKTLYNMQSIIPYSDRAPIAILADWRYRSTYTYFKERFGKIITICLIRDKDTTGYSKNVLQHHSEIDLHDFPFDYEIHNDGTIEQLDEKAQIVAQSIV